MSTSTWRSKWLDSDPNSRNTAHYGADKTDKTGSVSFGGSSFGSFKKQSQPSPPAGSSEEALLHIDAQDRATWPPYLLRLERLSREQFGECAAQRQVRAELAFLERAESEGWRLLPEAKDKK